MERKEEDQIQQGVSKMAERSGSTKVQGVRGVSSGCSSERGLSHCALWHSVPDDRKRGRGWSSERRLSHCALWHSVQGVRGGGSGWSSGRRLSHCALWHKVKGVTGQSHASDCVERSDAAGCNDDG